MLWIKTILQCLMILMVPPFLLVLWNVIYFSAYDLTDRGDYGFAAMLEYYQPLAREPIFFNIFLAALGIIFLFWLLLSLVLCAFLFADLRNRNIATYVDLDIKEIHEKVLYNLFERSIVFLLVFLSLTWLFINSGYRNTSGAMRLVEVIRIKNIMFYDYRSWVTISLFAFFIAAIAPDIYSAFLRADRMRNIWQRPKEDFVETLAENLIGDADDPSNDSKI